MEIIEILVAAEKYRGLAGRMIVGGQGVEAPGKGMTWRSLT